MSLFDQVRGAERLASGDILVVDGASNELRYFDEFGVHRATVGGNGDGPGEFRHASAIIAVRADSVWVLDHFAARLSVFRPDGTLERTLALTGIQGFTPLRMLPFGIAPDGQILIRGAAAAPPAGAGAVMVSAPLFLANTTSGELTEIATMPAAMAARDAQGRPQPLFPSAVSVPVSSAGGAWTNAPNTAELQQIGWDGSLKRIVRFPHRDGAFTAAEQERILAWRLSSTSHLPEEALAAFASPIVLTRMPAVAWLLVDSLDHLWVQEIRNDRDPDDWEFAAPRGSHRWKVFDPSGNWLGSVNVPQAFQPHSIGDDYLLGVSKDESGVESIHMYSLSRN